MAEPYDTLTTSTTNTPQGVPVPGREAEQIANAAGGYVFRVDPWTRLVRFLVLGTTSGTYYQSAGELTKEAVLSLRDALAEDGLRFVRTVVEVSEEGRAVRNDPAIYALALAMTPPFADEAARRAAAESFTRVCRTFAHVASFCTYLESLRGWGELPRRALRSWYMSKSPAALAFSGVKYPQRSGWRQRDALRLAHPDFPSIAHRQVYDWLTHGLRATGQDMEGRAVGLLAEMLLDEDGKLHSSPNEGWPEYAKVIWSGEAALGTVDGDKARPDMEGRLLSLIREARLPWEAVPMAWRWNKAAWMAALPAMPPHALVRNLGQLTARGVLASDTDEATRAVVAKLRDVDLLKAARLHPGAVLQALAVYASGRGERGHNTWQPLRSILDALDGAFYACFANVEPMNVPVLLAIDSSGSMQGQRLAAMPSLSATQAAAAFACMVASTESAYDMVAFDDDITRLAVSPRQRMDDVIRSIPVDPKATDASLPFSYALSAGLRPHGFVIITDNETWAGDRHPFQALQQYRRATGIPARLAVVAMTASRGSIGEVGDAGTLDVVGFDSQAPRVIADFIAGRF